MNDKLLPFLGLCRRANKLCYGFDAVIKSVTQKKAKLILFASDVSPHTKSDVEKVCEKENVKTLTLDFCKEDISLTIGKYAAVVSITDSGFANRICELAQ